MKPILFLGDSITEGIGASAPEKAFVPLVGKAGYPVLNYGLSGTRFARQKAPSICTSFDYDFLLREPVMTPDASFVFVFGGTNDFGHGDATFGKLGDRDPYTFYGAVTLLGEALLAKYGAAKLCFILPLPTYDSGNPYGNGSKKVASHPLKDYRAAEKEVLDSLGIPWVDFARYFPEPTSQQDQGYFRDGLHPNDQGHAKLAELIVAYLKKHLPQEK